jgi:hypothetical protein
MGEFGDQLLGAFSDPENPLPANPEGVDRLEAAIEAVAQPPDPAAVSPLPDLARLISGKTYVFDPNPATLERVEFAFEGLAEATGFIQFGGRQPVAVPVGLDGVYRFTPGPDGRPQAYRGAWTDPQTFSLEYDGITNNDHAFLQFHFEGDEVEVSIHETAHEGSVQFMGRLQ